MSHEDETSGALDLGSECFLVGKLRFPPPAHPEWTLGTVLAYASDGRPHSAVLLGLTFRELLTTPNVTLVLPKDGGPVVDAGRLMQARRARREEEIQGGEDG